MTIFSLFGFGKEFILINDSLVIMSVMILLLTIMIKKGKNLMEETFNLVREETKNDLKEIMKQIVSITASKSKKKEFEIMLNEKRSLLLAKGLTLSEELISSTFILTTEGIVLEDILEFPEIEEEVI